MRRAPGRAATMMISAVTVPLVVSVLAPIARMPVVIAPIARLADHGDDSHPAFDRPLEERLLGGTGAPRHERNQRDAEGDRNHCRAAG